MDLIIRRMSLRQHFGRFGLFYVQAIKGNIVSPFLATLLSAILLGISVVLIIDILKIKSKIFKIIVAIIMAVAPNFSATLMFFYCSDAYMIAMLFAVLAVFVVTKYSKNKFMPLLGGLFISLSMGMYQTYLSVTMVLFASLILIDLLNKENLKEVVKNGLKYLLTGVIGLVLYFIFMNLALSMRQLDMNSYSGANEIGLSNIIFNLPNLLPETYRDFLDITLKILS